MDEFISTLRSRLAIIPANADVQSHCADLMQGLLSTLESLGSRDAKREGLAVAASKVAVVLDLTSQQQCSSRAGLETAEVPGCLSVKPTETFEGSLQENGSKTVSIDEVDKGVEADTGDSLLGACAAAICSNLLDALQVLDHLCQRISYCRSNAAGLDISSATMDEEDKRFLQLEISVRQLIAINGFHLSTDGEFWVAFLDDALQAKEKGDLSGIITKTIVFPLMSHRILSRMPHPYSDAASKQLADVSLRALVANQPGKVAAMKEWREVVCPTKEKGKECYKLRYIEPSLWEGARVAVCPDEELEANSKQWDTTLIGYVMDRRSYYVHLKREMEKQWKPKGKLDIFTRENGVFLFKFASNEDCTRILVDGLWYFDRRLIVRGDGISV